MIHSIKELGDVLYFQYYEAAPELKENIEEIRRNSPEFISDFAKYPSAPEFIDSTVYSGSSLKDKSNMRGGLVSDFINLVVSNPLIPGRVMSIITRSGFNLLHNSTALLPSDVLPIIFTDGKELMNLLRDSRNFSLVSTKSTRNQNLLELLVIQYL